MKCPYMDFKECLIEKCPSCNFEKHEREIISGRYPAYMSTEDAIERGTAWRDTVTEYKFKSCKLVDNNVQPVPQKKEVINNTQKTSIVIHKSIF
ncbi:MAG: hypothetical protein H2212_15120 [Ruminococcus sp.]|nr:hypothetical protein [Ruminococcus sp.]